MSARGIPSNALVQGPPSSVLFSMADTPRSCNGAGLDGDVLELRRMLRDLAGESSIALAEVDDLRDQRAKLFHEREAARAQVSRLSEELNDLRQRFAEKDSIVACAVAEVERVKVAVGPIKEANAHYSLQSHRQQLQLFDAAVENLCLKERLMATEISLTEREEFVQLSRSADYFDLLAATWQARSLKVKTRLCDLALQVKSLRTSTQSASSSLDASQRTFEDLQRQSAEFQTCARGIREVKNQVEASSMKPAASHALRTRLRRQHLPTTATGQHESTSTATSTASGGDIHLELPSADPFQGEKPFIIAFCEALMDLTEVASFIHQAEMAAASLRQTHIGMTAAAGSSTGSSAGQILQSGDRDAPALPDRRMGSNAARTTESDAGGFLGVARLLRGTLF